MSDNEAYIRSSGTIHTIMLTPQEYGAMQSEIARLKAELEKAEGDRLFAIDMRDTSWRCYRNAQEERDEARKWARSLLRLAEFWHKMATKRTERDDKRIRHGRRR